MDDKIDLVEKNTIDSFRLAKKDITMLQHGYIDVSQSQNKILEKLSKVYSREARLIQRIRELESRLSGKSNTSKRRRTRNVYVASKGRNEFHMKNCPFAQNIKPKMKITFRSKIKALNEGYKACRCVR